MGAGLDGILQDIETLIDYKIEQKITERKLDVESYGSSITEFERMYLSEYEGNELLSHVRLRDFLRYQQAYNDYRFNTDTETVLSRIRYLTPNPTQSVGVGEIPAIIQNLVISGAGILPISATTTPDKVGFDYNKDLVKGQWGYNETDDLWYYGSATGVKELKPRVDFTPIYNEIDDLQEQLDTLAGYILVKASTESVTALDGRVTTAETSITQNSEQIALRATTETVDAIGQRLTEAEATLTVTASQITSKVSQTDFNTLGERVSIAETAIIQTAESITSKASKASVDTLTGAVTQLSSEVTQTASRWSVLLNEDNTVKAAFIIECINGQSTATISADKITLQGGVTFVSALNSKLNSDDLFDEINNSTNTTIDGGRITTGTITSLGIIESFEGLYVSDPSIEDEYKRIFGVEYSNANNTFYPKMFLGRRHTTDELVPEEGFVVERDPLDGKYKFFIGNANNYLKFDGTKLKMAGAEIKTIVNGIQEDIYTIVNGTVVFNRPIASRGNITAYSSEGDTGTLWDQLVTVVDGTTVQYANSKISVIAGVYLKLNSPGAPENQTIYGNVHVVGNITASGSITPNS